MRKALVLAAGILLLTVGWAQANQVMDMYFSSTYTSPIYMDLNGTPYTPDPLGGGSINTTLNGVAPSYTYCLQYSVDVFVPADYSQTLVNNQGSIDGSTTSNGTSVQNAKNIAWLLENFGQGGQGGAQAGLQAAIWYETSNGALTLDTNSYLNSQIPGAVSAYEADLEALAVALGEGPGGNALGSGNGLLPNYISNFDWITPMTTANGTPYQAQISLVPEPATLLFLGLGLIGLPIVRRLRKS